MPILQTAGQVAGQVVNAFETQANNKAQRDFDLQMYQRQRNDALADFNRQNQYNSPAAQMQRLRDANLNPNLVYGNGATTTAGVVRSTDVKGWNPQAPQYHPEEAVSSGLSAYYDIKLKEAQVDLLKQQNTVSTQDALLKAAQTANTVQQTATGGFNLEQAKTLQSTSLQVAEQNLKKLVADTDFTLQQTGINAIKLGMDQRAQESGLAVQAEQILRSRAERSNTDLQRKELEERIDNLHKDATIKQLDIELKKLGIQPGDALWQRILGRIIGDPGTVGQRIQNSPLIKSLPSGGYKRKDGSRINEWDKDYPGFGY